MQGIDPHAPVVRLHNVGMRYGGGPEILRDISFTLARGAFCFLTGESGAGKSSLLRLMYLAQRPTRGVTALFGRDLVTVPRRELPELRRNIGVVFQDFRLIDHLTTLENVALPLRVGGAKGTDVTKHVAEISRLAGIRLLDFGVTMESKDEGIRALAKPHVLELRVFAKPHIQDADEDAQRGYVRGMVEACSRRAVKKYVIRTSGMSTLLGGEKDLDKLARWVELAREAQTEAL